MRLARRTWLFLLVMLAFGVFLSVYVVLEISAGPAAQPLSRATVRPQQTATPTFATTPLVYPLPARFRINSLVDHNSPNYERTPTIAVYTGGMVSDDSGDPNDQFCYATTPGAIQVCSYTDYSTPATPAVEDLRWDQDIEGAGTGGPGWLWYDGHAGYDLGCPSGTSVNAAGAGIPYKESNTTWYIDDGNGYRTYYYHLSSVLVPELTPVAVGRTSPGAANTMVTRTSILRSSETSVAYGSPSTPPAGRGPGPTP